MWPRPQPALEILARGTHRKLTATDSYRYRVYTPYTASTQSFSACSTERYNTSDLPLIGGHVQTKNIHHGLSGSSLVVSGSLERGVVARGGRLEQARGDQQQGAREESTCLGSSSADQPPALHAPALTNEVKCCRPATSVMWRVTSAKRARWAESGLAWLGRDRSVGVLKKDKKDSSAPRYNTHIAATQAPRTWHSSKSGAHAH